MKVQCVLAGFHVHVRMCIAVEWAGIEFPNFETIELNCATPSGVFLLLLLQFVGIAELESETDKS